MARTAAPRGVHGWAAVLVLCGLSAGGVVQAAQVLKCTGADGAVTYSDEPCPRGTRGRRIEVVDPSPSPYVPEAFRPAPESPATAAPVAAPASPPAAVPTLARQCGEARTDAHWYALQDDATRRDLAGEERVRQRFISEHCR